MADFTLSAPGTTNNPWVAPGITMPIGTMQSDATGFFYASGPNGYCAFAHNSTYGPTITATVQASALSGGDPLVLGALVRTGANAGAIIGVELEPAGVIYPLTVDASGNATTLATSVSMTWITTDVMKCIVAISGGVATITAFQNASQFTFASNTTTNFASETTLAAGGLIAPQNINGTKINQFTGTGVAGGTAITPTVGSTSVTGITPTVTKRTNTVIAPFVAQHGGRVLTRDRRILIPTPKTIFLPTRKAA